MAVPVVAAIALGAAGGAASAAPSKGRLSLKARAQGLVEAGYPAALAAMSDSKGDPRVWLWVRAVWETD